MKKIAKWICFSSFLILLSGCFRNYIDRSYFGDPVEGWVIDSTTQKPIPNVVVHIEWDAESVGLWAHYNYLLHIDETVTDQNGYFKFPVWGPKQAKQDTVGKSPTLIFFKENFYIERVHYFHLKQKYEGEKAIPFSFNWRLIPKSYPLSDNKVVAMKPFDGDLKKYVEDIDHFSSFRLNQILHTGCERWSNIPKTIGRLFKVKKQLKEELAKRGITETSKRELVITYNDVHNSIIDFAEFKRRLDNQDWQDCPNLEAILQIISEEETSP